MVVLLLDDAGLDHFIIEVVALTCAFAHAREHGDAAVQLGDVVDQLHDDDGLADAGAAERADLAALEERADEVNDLDAGGENLRAGGLVHQRRGGAVNRAILVRDDRPAFVHGLPVTSNTRPMTPSPTGMEMGVPVSRTSHAALEAVGGGHGDGADPVVAQVLLHFERQLGLAQPGRSYSMVSAL